MKHCVLDSLCYWNGSSGHSGIREFSVCCSLSSGSVVCSSMMWSFLTPVHRDKANNRPPGHSCNLTCLEQHSLICKTSPNTRALIRLKFDGKTTCQTPPSASVDRIHLSASSLWSGSASSSLRSGICWATKARFRGSVWPCMLMKTLFSLVKLARRVPSAAERELANTTAAPAK